MRTIPAFLILCAPVMADWRVNSFTHDGEAMARAGATVVHTPASAGLWSSPPVTGFQARAYAGASLVTADAIANQYVELEPWWFQYFGSVSTLVKSSLTVRPEGFAEAVLDVDFDVLHPTTVPFKVWASPSIQRGHGDWSITITGPNYAFVADTPTVATLSLPPGAYNLLIEMEASALASDPETSYQRVDSRRSIGMEMLMIDEPQAWSLVAMGMLCVAWRMRGRRHRQQ